MNVPGANLLSMALRVVSPQGLQWRAWTSRSPNIAGDYVDVFAVATTIQGSAQPVPRSMYQMLGLDLSKNYLTVYTSADVRVLQRDRPGDLILWDGRTWQGESDTNWRAVDGWRKLLFIEVQPRA